MIASLHQSELCVLETSDTVLVTKTQHLYKIGNQPRFFMGFYGCSTHRFQTERDSSHWGMSTAYIHFEKSSRMLLKKLYFIVLFTFRLMSIKYTLTCVQHMWACNTTWSRNNEKMHIHLPKTSLKKSIAVTRQKRALKWISVQNYKYVQSTRKSNSS